jgi:hypothetical protein
MSGEHDKLRQALEELQAHLAELRQIDASAAANLDATIADAQNVLGAKAAGQERHTVAEQFSEALQHYEASHPTLAGNLRSVIDALAQIGI